MRGSRSRCPTVIASAHPYRMSSLRNFRLNNMYDWFRGDETSWLNSLCSATVHNRGRFDDVASSCRSNPPDHRKRRLGGLKGYLSDVLSHKSRCCTRICWCWSDTTNSSTGAGAAGNCWCWGDNSSTGAAAAHESAGVGATNSTSGVGAAQEAAGAGARTLPQE